MTAELSSQRKLYPGFPPVCHHLSAVQGLTHGILSSILRGRYQFYPHSPDGETEAWESSVEAQGHRARESQSWDLTLVL